MLIINVIVLLIFALLYLMSLRGDKEWYKTLDQKEHKLYFLYPMANLILIKTGLHRLLYRKEKVMESIKALNVAGKTDNLQKLYWCSKISLIIAILFLFNLLSLMGQLQVSGNSKIMNGRYLMRPDYGEGNDTAELNVTMEKKSQKGSKEDVGSNRYSEDVTVQIKERIYAKEERSKLFEDAKKYLDSVILGGNESFDNVNTNLNFITKIPGTGIKVEWRPEDYSIIQGDGTVNNQEVAPDGTVTTVSAILTYEEDQSEYRKTFKIMPRTYSEEERLAQKLESKLTEADEKTGQAEKLELPDRIYDYDISWKENKENTGSMLFILGILTAVVIWLYNDKELADKMKKRKEQMLMDYPDIINKFTLLINAGMTVKQAWSKIASDYEAKYLVNQTKKRFAYEEMLVTAHELKLGVTESEAYEQFGRRAGLLPYLKFSTL
ncbi:MAG TPA: hypothetical protein VN131_01835, partial [Mobilitalea sp.]|nr:hypothetical protein [Mobilitalea sp.]